MTDFLKFGKYSPFCNSWDEFNGHKNTIICTPVVRGGGANSKTVGFWAPTSNFGVSYPLSPI